MYDALLPGVATPTKLKLVPLAEVDSFAVDYHMHTSHTDGTATAQEMAESAAGNGINEILFSEHVRQTSDYYPAFADEIRGLQIPDLSIRLGIETKVLDVDGTLDCSEEVVALGDAILGSVHRTPADANGRHGEWPELNTKDALELEFQMAMAIVTKSRAHVLAHPMGMVVTKFNLKPLDRLYELARACREFDKAFELNTRYCSSPKEWVEIVQRAGCKVSFGSDAHKTEDVGSSWHLFNLERKSQS